MLWLLQGLLEGWKVPYSTTNSKQKYQCLVVYTSILCSSIMFICPIKSFQNIIYIIRMPVYFIIMADEGGGKNVEIRKTLTIVISSGNKQWGDKICCNCRENTPNIESTLGFYWSIHKRVINMLWWDVKKKDNVNTHEIRVR